MIIIILIMFFTIIGLFLTITNMTQQKTNFTEEPKQDFLNINNKEKENFILSKTENHLRTYLSCLKINNYNQMKFICDSKFFQILKNLEKHNELLNKNIANYENIQIINQGIIEYKEYQNVEYVTVAIIIKGQDRPKNDYEYSYSVKHSEFYQKYTITYKIPINTNDILITNINKNY